MQPYVLFSPKEWRLPARSFIINLFILTLLSVTLLSSQTPYWHWAKRAGGTLNEKGNSIAVDEQGNSHVIGNFTSAEITLGSTTFPNVSGFDEYSDLFLVKYDPSGNVVWATTAGGTDDEYGYGIAVDASGNSFVTGTFNSPTLTFGSTTLTRNGDFDIFIAKYDANGNAVWATGAGGTGGDEGKKIAVDASGNSYVTGRFTSPTLTFGSTTLTNNGLGDIFIVKYDANGNVAWASSAGGTSRDYGEGVAVGASGKISLAGYFTSPTITIGSITLSNTTSDDNDDIFVVQYDTNGSVQWAASAGGIGFDRASDISLDDSGNSYVTGTFENSDITFGTFTLTNLGFNDIFVVKYGSAGNVVWARSAGGTGGEYGTCISTDASGNSYVGGYFKSSTLTFDTTALSNNGGGDIFLANYDVSGNTVWATSVGGIANEYAYGIFVDASGNSFVTGEFSSDTLIFDSDTLIENGYDDFFVAKFGPPSASIITASSGPNGNITPSGDVTVYNGATQQFTFTANTGYHVDSVIVDGVNIGSTTSYTFENVTANHTIQVVFAINTYTLTVGGDNGVVGKNPNLESYEHGTTVQVSQTPDRGYIFTGWSGDASGTDNPLSVTMDRNKSILANYLVNSDYEVRYRTAKYEDWATAKDGKGALKSIKRKADKVFFKFNLTRATASNLLLLDFGMDVNAIITRGKAKTDTIVRFSTNKFKGELETVAAGETIQVEGIGKKGKKITVKYQWGTAKAVTMKADSLYKINRVGLPMPNLHNVVEELFAQGAFPGGLQIGYPQGAKGANSVIHKKYADVQKSMVKIVMKNPKLHADTLAARCLDSLDGTKKKAMSSQQKSLPPNKQNNKLFAELLTLRLNRQASVYEKFPVGLGQLTFDDPNNVGHPFNGMMVDEISLIADSMLSCLEISLDVTPNELYEIIRMLNCAFADSTIDTLSFGSKTKLTGVKSLFEVDYLQPTPGIAPRIVQSFDVTESIIPERFELSQNYPNPFNPSTQLSFVIGQSSLVSLKVFNMLGQEVATLLKKEEMEEGEYELPFNAVSAAGGLPSGVYFYRINVESVDEDGIIHYFSDSKRMMFIK